VDISSIIYPGGWIDKNPHMSLDPWPALTILPEIACLKGLDVVHGVAI